MQSKTEMEEQQRKKEQEEKQALIDQIEQLKDLILAMQGLPKPVKQVAVESPKIAKKEQDFVDLWFNMDFDDDEEQKGESHH